jgi:hypothetical protein
MCDSVIIIVFQFFVKLNLCDFCITITHFITAGSEVQSITRELRNRGGDSDPHIPLVEPPSPGIIQEIIKLLLIDGYEVLGSSLTNINPSDIDVHVPGLQSNVVEVYEKIKKSLSRIECDDCQVNSTIEKTNIPYGENTYCRYLIVVTVLYKSGEMKEFIIDLTDGDFPPPVYFTGTVKARRVECNMQPPITNRVFYRNMRGFDSRSLNNKVLGNTRSDVFVPNYKKTLPFTTLEKVMAMQKKDRSEVNPQSVLFGYNIIASLDAIRRISDTNTKGKFPGGVDYKQTVEITVSKKNLCKPDWCSCNQGADHIYQHGSTKRTYVTLQCCGTTVCADLLTKDLKAMYKAQFCPFSGPDGPHFMQFLHDSLMEPKVKSLMGRLNWYWELIKIGRETTVARENDEDMKEKNLDPNVGPHGDGCSCRRTIKHNKDSLYASRNCDMRNVPPFYDHSYNEMPEINWGDDLKYPSNTNTKTMKPHCETPGCEQCKYKMECFQIWASSQQVTPDTPELVAVKSLQDHMALFL